MGLEEDEHVKRQKKTKEKEGDLRLELGGYLREDDGGNQESQYGRFSA